MSVLSGLAGVMDKCVEGNDGDVSVGFVLASFVENCFVTRAPTCAHLLLCYSLVG